MDGVEHTVRLCDHITPHSPGSFVESCIAGDARIGYHNFHGPEIGFNLRQTRFGRLIISDIPLVGLNAGRFSKGRSLFIIPGVGGGDLVFRLLSNALKSPHQCHGSRP